MIGISDVAIGAPSSVDFVRVDPIGLFSALIHSLHGLFEGHYHEERPSPHDANPAQSYADLSCRYIAEIAAFRDTLVKGGQTSAADTCRNMESVLMICHVMFVLPHESISRQVVTWFQFHQRFNMAADEPMDDTNIYQRILRLILSGRIVDCLSLIRSEGVPDLDSTMSELASIIATIPLIDPSNVDMTSAQFHLKYRQYKRRIAQFVQLPSVRSNPDLTSIGRVLNGELDSIEQFGTSWLHHVVAALLFTSPNMTKHDLADFVQMAKAQNEQSIAMDDILTSILSNDAASTLLSIRVEFRSLFLDAHLGDLLQRSIQLYRPNLEDQETLQTLRASSLFDFGCQILTDANTWQLAPTYLVHCGDQGLMALKQAFVLHVHNDFSALKLLDYAIRLDMMDEHRHICNQMATRMLSLKRPLQALIWAMRAKENSTRIAQIAQYITEQFTLEISNFDLSLEHVEEFLSNLRSASDTESSNAPIPCERIIRLCEARAVVSQPSVALQVEAALVFLDRHRQPNRLRSFVADFACRLITTDQELGTRCRPESIRLLMRHVAGGSSRDSPDVIIHWRAALVNALAITTLANPAIQQ